MALSAQRASQDPEFSLNIQRSRWCGRVGKVCHQDHLPPESPAFSGLSPALWMSPMSAQEPGSQSCWHADLLYGKDDLKLANIPNSFSSGARGRPHGNGTQLRTFAVWERSGVKSIEGW